MKYSRLIISLIISTLLFMFSLEVYDAIIGSRFYENIYFYHQKGLLIESDSNFDDTFIIDTLTKHAQENNVTLQVAYGNPKHMIHFIYTDDLNVIDSFILKGNKRIDFLSSHHYSSNTKNDATQIFKPAQNTSLEVYPLKAYDQFDFNIQGEYSIYSKDKESIKNFIDDLNFSLKDYKLRITDVGYPEEDFTQSYSLELKDTFLLISLESLLAISIIFIVIRNTKKISILRLEGYSTFEIFIKLIAKTSLISFFVVPLISLIIMLSVFSISHSVYNHLDLYIILFRYFLLLKSIDLIFLGIYYWIFSRISISEGIKGKNNLNVLYSSLSVLKIIFVVISLIPLNHATGTVNKYIQGERYYRDTTTYMKDKYFIGGTHSGSVANDFGKEKELKLIKNELITHHGAFRYADFILGDLNDESTFTSSYKQISADVNYLEKHDINIKTNRQSFVVSSDPNYCVVNKEIHEYWECIYNPDLSDSLISYSPHSDSQYPILGYFPNYKHQKSPYLLFVDEDDSISGMIFQNEFGLKKAQETLDNLYLKYDIKPLHTVEDLKANIDGDRRIMQSFLIKALLSLLSIITAYVFLSKVTSEVDSLNNKTKYYLEFVEGRHPFAFLLENTVKNLISYLIISIIGILLNVSIPSLLVIISMILIADTLTYTLTLKNIRKEEE